MTFYLLDLIRKCADQPSINKLSHLYSTPRLVVQCSFSHPTELSPYNNSSHCIFSCCQQRNRPSTRTDRQQERSHYRRQLPKYFVWVELFSQVFIQSETLGENVKLLYGVFQVLVQRERERERERSLLGAAVVMK
jgi:hypothetical protein